MVTLTLDFSRCRLPPFQHQREDVGWLLPRSYSFVASEMRTGKTKIIIDLAQFLYERNEIDKVIVVAPAPVRFVWANPELGEIAKHAWTDVPNKVVEYHARFSVWSNMMTAKGYLHWYVTNFEFLRSAKRLEMLLEACGKQTLLIGDESSFLKNHKALQTKAFVELRERCGRVILMNGTPIFHSPLDLFSQANILHPSILQCKYITHFKAKYAIQQPVLATGGKPMMNDWGKPVLQIAGWINLEDIERRLKPHTIRRLQKDCLDLPPKLDPVNLTATLGDDEWRAYRDMRDEMLVWLKEGKVVTSATAAIKALRLSQITGGFLSGIEDANIGPDINGTNSNNDEWDLFTEDNHEDGECTGNKPTAGRSRPGRHLQSTRGHQSHHDTEPRDQQADPGGAEEHRGTTSGGSDKAIEGMIPIGRAKLDVLMWFIERGLEADPCLKVVSWSRFRAEAVRAYDEVRKKYPAMECALLLGGQKRDERLRALSLLKPETAPKGPVFIAGIEGTGSFGLDMTASHTCITLSAGYSPGRSMQTLDRVYGPGQKNPIAYYNVIATGPKGQRTIDQDILTARISGEDIATRTAAAWVKALGDE